MDLKILSGATKNRLTPETVQNILAEVKAGAVKMVVARKYNIDHSLIYHYLKKAGITILRKKSAWASKKDYNREYKKRNREKILKYSYEYRNTKKFSKKIKGKSYKELLAIENEKRKKKGWYQLKNSSKKQFYIKTKTDKEIPSPSCPPQTTDLSNCPEADNYYFKNPT